MPKLANLARRILATLSLALNANARILQDSVSLPSYDTITNAFNALKGRTKLLLLKE